MAARCHSERGPVMGSLGAGPSRCCHGTHGAWRSFLWLAERSVAMHGALDRPLSLGCEVILGRVFVFQSERLLL